MAQRLAHMVQRLAHMARRLAHCWANLGRLACFRICPGWVAGQLVLHQRQQLVAQHDLRLLFGVWSGVALKISAAIQ